MNAIQRNLRYAIECLLNEREDLLFNLSGMIASYTQRLRD